MAIAANIKGTKDYFSTELQQRDYIMSVIKEAFKVYGFEPIETPAMENLSTLMGKYGEEGDQLIFKVLNSGDYLNKADEKSIIEKNSTLLTPSISSKALRYDLTIPFARFVAQHSHELAFPFKRYQMQPVWRADRPQKGRLREFYQCDADVVGSDSLWQEVEFVQLYDDVFSRLGLAVNIHLNNRKILTGITEVLQIPDKLTSFTVALDKLDKLGKEKVVEEMVEKGIPLSSIQKIEFLLNHEQTDKEKLEKLQILFKDNQIGQKGIEEILFIQTQIEKLNLKSARLVIDFSLARGLNYYTGTIMEVKTKNSQVGSIGAGGRYDNLTTLFGLAGIGGVGISFGVDRILLALEEASVLQPNEAYGTDFLFVNFGDKETASVYPIIQALRKKGKVVELYPDTVKIKKQLQYADKKGVRYAVLAGDSELAEDSLIVKKLSTGEQEKLTIKNFLEQNM